LFSSQEYTQDNDTYLYDTLRMYRVYAVADAFLYDTYDKATDTLQAQCYDVLLTKTKSYEIPLWFDQYDQVLIDPMTRTYDKDRS
jgi:hypothetical protein